VIFLGQQNYSRVYETCLSFSIIRSEPCAELDSVSFQHLIRFSLPLADTPFIPVHKTGFSGAISNKRNGEIT
jgi:hypothetical protein